MEPAESGANRECRVEVRSKKQVTAQIDQYKNILRAALDGQAAVAEETKRALLQELLANFEAAVQDNVLVNGLPWEEAPNNENEYDLDDQLDEAMVETAWRRRRYPKVILPHAVHALKAERKILELYEHAIKPQELVKDPDQERIMNDVSAAAPAMAKEATQVIKSIDTLKKQTEGLREILDMKPSQTTLEINREVFGFRGKPDAPTPPENRAARSARSIKRAVEEAAATNCYVPLGKKPVGEGKPE